MTASSLLLFSTGTPGTFSSQCLAGSSGASDPAFCDAHPESASPAHKAVTASPCFQRTIFFVMVIPLRKTLGTGAFLRPDVLFEFHLVQCQQHPAVRIDDLGVPPSGAPARGTVSSMMRQAACTMASTAASKLQ